MGTSRDHFVDGGAPSCGVVEGMATPKRPAASKNRDGQSKGRHLPARLSTDEPLSSRLRQLRQERGISLREMAGLLSWSVSRLISYEGGDTEPSVSEISRLSSVFGLDPAWLAFGDAYLDGAVGRARSKLVNTWIPAIGGGELAIPISLLAAHLGPFQCLVLGEDALGLHAKDIVLLQTAGRKPIEGEVWAVNVVGGRPKIGWIDHVGGRQVAVRLTLNGSPLSVNSIQLLGKVIATMCAMPARTSSD